MFADGVAILATAPTNKAAKEKAQRTVDVVVKWSEEWRLTLNSSKNESSLFTTYRKEAKNEVSIFIHKKRISFNPEPKFLGVPRPRTDLCQTRHRDRYKDGHAVCLIAQDMGLHQKGSDETLHLPHPQHHGLLRSRLAAMVEAIEHGCP